MENTQYSVLLLQVTENLTQACIIKQGNLLTYISENSTGTSIFRPSFTPTPSIISKDVIEIQYLSISQLWSLPFTLHSKWQGYVIAVSG